MRRGEAAAVRVLRGHACVGLVFAVALGIASFVFHAGTASRAVCSVGAMSCLFGAAVSLNLSDRILRKKPAYTLIATAVLGIVAAGAVGVGLMAWERDVEGSWSPILGAGFILVLAAISWRLSRWRSTTQPRSGDPPG